MKKAVLLMMMTVTVWTALFAQERRYGIESAILKKNVVIRPQIAIMEQSYFAIQYIADYGQKESAETFMDIQGQKVTVFTMMKDGYVYSTNMAANQGTKINIAAMMEDYKTVNYLNLTDEDRKKYQIEEKGNEQFLGKDCKSYELTVTAQGQTVKVAVLVWQGLALKSSTIASGTTMIEETTEIQEGVAIAKEKFELPEGINFVEMSLPNL